MRRFANKEDLIRQILALVVGILFVVTAIEAVCTGHIKMDQGGGVDISSAAHPVVFWMLLALCAMFGTFAVFALLKKL